MRCCGPRATAIRNLRCVTPAMRTLLEARHNQGIVGDFAERHVANGEARCIFDDDAVVAVKAGERRVRRAAARQVWRVPRDCRRCGSRSIEDRWRRWHRSARGPRNRQRRAAWCRRDCRGSPGCARLRATSSSRCTSTVPAGNSITPVRARSPAGVARNWRGQRAQDEQLTHVPLQTTSMATGGKAPRAHVDAQFMRARTDRIRQARS